MFKLILLVCVSAAPENLGPEAVYWLRAQRCYCVGRPLLDGPHAGLVRVSVDEAGVPRKWTATPSPQAAPSLQAERALAPASTDPYGIGPLFNAVRAQYGLGRVTYDASLSTWAHRNNNRQLLFGLGHWVMGPVRFQNSAAGMMFGEGTSLVPMDARKVIEIWMSSPGHRAAMLSPVITVYGVHQLSKYWTLNMR